MAFGCDLYYTINGYTNTYGCDSSYNGWYNANYGRCCSEGWTTFAAWMLWITVCLIFVAIMVAAARARQRRRMMYMEQMQMNQQPGAVIIQTTGPAGQQQYGQTAYAPPGYQQPQPGYYQQPSAYGQAYGQNQYVQQQY